MATAQVIAFDQSIKFLESVLELKILIKHEKEINRIWSRKTCRKINSVKLIGNPKERGGVIIFYH